MNATASVSIPPWLAHLRRLQQAGQTAVLVRVLKTQGSAPRKAGARMVVSEDAVIDTIGGGHLEWQAIRIARDLLAAPGPHQQRRFPLGAALGQCCGGAVWLGFDPVGPQDAWVADACACLAAHTAWVPRDADAAPPGLILIAPPARCLWLFGGGHVGQALVRALHGHDLPIHWVDGRWGDSLPWPEADTLPPNVQVWPCTDAEHPEDVLMDAHPGDLYLVMTHSHAQDEALAWSILNRGDAGWFGLIGSATKRRRFEQRFLQRGLPPASLTRLCCPIGLAGVDDKQPVAVAIATAAQVLQVVQQLQQARPPIDQAPGLVGVSPSRTIAGLSPSPTVFPSPKSVAGNPGPARHCPSDRKTS